MHYPLQLIVSDLSEVHEAREPNAYPIVFCAVLCTAIPHVSAQERDAHAANLSARLAELLLYVLFLVEKGTHESNGIVALQPSALIADDSVSHRVRSVETIACMRLDLRP